MCDVMWSDAFFHFVRVIFEMVYNVWIWIWMHTSTLFCMKWANMPLPLLLFVSHTISQLQPDQAQRNLIPAIRSIILSSTPIHSYWPLKCCNNKYNDMRNWFHFLHYVCLYCLFHMCLNGWFACCWSCFAYTLTHL